MRFPLTIKHRRAVAKIYGKTAAYGFYRAAWHAGGKRHVRSFATFADAKAAAEAKVRELANGNQAPALTAREVTAALSIRDALEAVRKATGRDYSPLECVTGYLDAVKPLPAGVGLSEAVRGYCQTIAAVQRTDLSKAVEEFCRARDAKAVAGPGKRPALSPVYVADTARQLRDFAAANPGHAVCDLTREHLAIFVEAHGKLSPKSRNHFRATLRMFLRWCIRQDWLPTNTRLLDADALQREPLDNEPIDYYRPNELAAMLANCDPEMQPVIALQALGGLRLQEALRLDWRDVFGIDGHVEVSASKSKTRSRRLVEIGPALALWLEPFRGREGKVTSQTLDAYTWQFIKLRERLEIPSRKNGLRHGFITFHFALHGNENATAQLAGHSPQMLHQFYRGLATKTEAEKWFAVKPAESAENVIPLPAASRKQAH